MPIYSTSSAYTTTKYAFNVHHLTPTPNSITDSVSIWHYVSIETPHTNRRIANNPNVVMMRDGNTAISTYTFCPNLPSLPPEAREGQVFPQFPAGALLSIVALCDYGCIAELNATLIGIKLSGAILLRRVRSPATKIFDKTLPSIQKHKQIHLTHAVCNHHQFYRIST